MTDGRMSRTLVSLARRRGRLPALVASLGIAATLILIRALNELISLAAASSIPSARGDLALGRIVDFLPQALPFALGVFLGLWLIAPLAGELTLPFVFTRGALATAAGSVLVILGQLVIATVIAIDERVFDGADLLRQAALAALTGASSLVNFLIPVLFASVLLWLWLREHPRDYAVSGLIDEV